MFPGIINTFPKQVLAFSKKKIDIESSGVYFAEED